MIAYVQAFLRDRHIPVGRPARTMCVFAALTRR